MSSKPRGLGHGEWWDDASSGIVTVPGEPTAFPETEVCRVVADYPAAWQVTISRREVAPLTLSREVELAVEWGHRRAEFRVDVDPDQSFCVHGSFARVLVSAPIATGLIRVPDPVTIVALISPIESGGGSAFQATLTRAVLLTPPGIGQNAEATVRVPRFSRAVRDSGGYSDSSGTIFLPARTFNFFSTDGVFFRPFGSSIIATNIDAPAYVPAGAPELRLVLDSTDPTLRTSLTWQLALC